MLILMSLLCVLRQEKHLIFLYKLVMMMMMMILNVINITKMDSETELV